MLCPWPWDVHGSTADRSRQAPCGEDVVVMCWGSRTARIGVRRTVGQTRASRAASSAGQAQTECGSLAIRALHPFKQSVLFRRDMVARISAYIAGQYVA